MLIVAPLASNHLNEVNEGPDGVNRQPSDGDIGVSKTLQGPVFLPGAATPAVPVLF